MSWEDAWDSKGFGRYEKMDKFLEKENSLSEEINVSDISRSGLYKIHNGSLVEGVPRADAGFCSLELGIAGASSISTASRMT